MKKTALILLSLLLFISVNAQKSGYWQQAISYQMDIDMDAAKHTYKGIQKITYTNNSPDTLYQVFYHLYFNAFQPGSEMDERSRNIADADGRVEDKIQKLTPEEIGFINVKTLNHNGKKVSYRTVGTILEVTLAEPINPGKKAVFEMEYNAQVPVQIRRSGRDNEEGIAYSMSQWYPKMCEYDEYGWHANPYIGREFHGVWGDFDIKISIDSAYTLAGTGEIKNINEIGKGYEEGGSIKANKSQTLTWNFVAKNVHDFAWAADKNYTLYSKQVPNGPKLYFVYQKNKEIEKEWLKLGDIMVKAISWMSENYGKYPYPVYSFIQAGDGGMEYPMCTFITGKRGLGSLVGVSVHELNHSWFQGVLAFNESLYSWMDEGFTSYTSEEVMSYLGYRKTPKANFENVYKSYLDLVEDGLNEPMTVHADYFITNRGYGTSAYTKGAMFLDMLRNVVGEKNYTSSMHRFFNEWKFKHPQPNDLKRIFEKESKMNLNWFFEQWINTTNTCDYGIRNIIKKNGKTYVEIYNYGNMNMPLELKIKTDKKIVDYYIPLQVMRNYKTDFKNENVITLAAWNWTNPSYIIEVSDNVEIVVIDQETTMPDANRENNGLIIDKEIEMMIQK